MSELSVRVVPSSKARPRRAGAREHESPRGIDLTLQTLQQLEQPLRVRSAEPLLTKAERHGNSEMQSQCDREPLHRMTLREPKHLAGEGARAGEDVRIDPVARISGESRLIDGPCALATLPHTHRSQHIGNSDNPETALYRPLLILTEQPLQDLGGELDLELRKALIEARKKADFTQAQLADRLGWNQSKVCNMETTASHLRVLDVAAWAQACGVKTLDLIRGPFEKAERALASMAPGRRKPAPKPAKASRKPAKSK